MTTCFLAPDPIQSTFFIPGGNTVANGGQLFFYAAGSSTKQTVYKDNAAAVAWTNPIVLDSGGNLPSGGEVWFTSGQNYKVIFAPSTDTDPPASPYWTKDNLAGINDVSAQIGVEWLSGPVPTFISATQFTVIGDQTANFTVGRRLKTTNTGGTVYSVITQASLASASTTVNVVSDGSGALDSGLSAVSYALLDPANPSISPSEINRKGANVASAGNGTTNIWGTVGDYIHITGTNTIWSFSNAPYAGARKEVIFDASLVINTSAAISGPGGNVTTLANDATSVRADTVSTMILTNYRTGAGGIGSSQVYAGPASGTSSSPSFRALVGAEASMTLISSTTAPNVSNIQFTNLGSSYDRYVVLLENIVPVTHGTVLQMIMSTSNAASYDTGAASYVYANSVRGADGVNYSNNSTSVASITMTGSTNALSSTMATGGSNLWVNIHRLGVTNVNKFVDWHGSYGGQTASAVIDGMGVGVGASNALQAGVVNAVAFLMGGGNVSSGAAYLYGIRKS